jgi:NAD(P)-dependent dehydrogenase (short-subunit alcohol dehydrogenase family)
MNMSGLQARTAVITGAGHGIGREQALFLATAGARVVVNDLGRSQDGAGQRSSDADEVVKEIVEAGGEAVASYDDVADERGAANLVNLAVGTFGGLDILINNADSPPDKLLADHEPDDLDFIMQLNLRGTFLPLREAARYWRERSEAGDEVVARVVNTSGEPEIFARAGLANYAAAKSAVASLTQVAARELERYGVAVNAILPRARRTMTLDVLADADADNEGEFDHWDLANISPFVAYLSSPQSDYTGAVFVVGGPWSSASRSDSWTRTLS